MSSSSSSIDASRDDTSNYNRAVDITAELEQIYHVSTQTQQKKLADHFIKTNFFKYLISCYEEVNYLNSYYFYLLFSSQVHNFLLILF